MIIEATLIDYLKNAHITDIGDNIFAETPKEVPDNYLINEETLQDQSRAMTKDLYDTIPGNNRDSIDQRGVSPEGGHVERGSAVPDGRLPRDREYIRRTSSG